MRNIHILPTEIPGRFSLKSNGEYCLSNYSYPDSPNFKNQNIYITSDEEIKDGDWYIYLGQINKRTRKNPEAEYPFPNYQKIILTTDQDLIKNGIQAIGDEFLEWFVKNPNCEFINVDEKTPDEIEVELNIHGHDIGLTDREFDEWLNNGGQLYKIIIPKKEPKTMLESLQEYLKNTPKEKVLEDWNEFQHLDEEGITVNEFLENQKQIDEKEK